MDRIQDKKRILLVNVNWLGDVLFSTPAIRAIRKAFASPSISCMIVPRVKEILEGNPNIDELIIYDEEGMHKSLIAKVRFIAQLKKKKFDLVILFHRSFSRTLICYLAGIPNRVGYSTSKRAFLLTQKIQSPRQSMHRIDYLSNIVNAIGIETDNSFCDFFIQDSDRTYIDKFLSSQDTRQDDTIVVLNPGGNWEPKRWMKENFARLADKLIMDFNLKVIISGGPKDIDLVGQITKLMNQKPVIACGSLTLKQLGALFEKAKLVISADSSPLHIAASLGTKIIGLYGPTSVDITGPRGRGYIKTIQKSVGCKIPCYDSKCSDFRCMKVIIAKDVLDEVYKALNLYDRQV